MRRIRRQAVINEAAGASEGGEAAPLKIGEVARRAGVGVETLRFYERAGLLDRPARTEGGYRLYDAETLKTLEFIKRAQSLGFTLAEIKRIIAESRAGQRPCAIATQPCGRARISACTPVVVYTHLRGRCRSSARLASATPRRGRSRWIST